MGERTMTFEEEFPSFKTLQKQTDNPSYGHCYPFDIHDGDAYEAEVIGNIYQSPELLR